MAKNKWISFFLCLFLGYLGIHKFYEGRVLLGIVYLLTFGLYYSLSLTRIFHKNFKNFIRATPKMRVALFLFYVGSVVLRDY